MRRLASNRVVVAAALLAGMVLRALFVWRHPPFNGDALVYGELAHHMLKEHVYGLIDAGVLKPTLIRLPGYPLFLAACFKVFGDANYLAVLWVQVVVDLATCLLLAATAARLAGRRAGMWVLWLAVLCPFTANYAAVAVAECCSLFCVALAFFALERWVTAWRGGARWVRWAALAGLALMTAVLLRPDQGLLAVAIFPAMKPDDQSGTNNTLRTGTTQRFAGAAKPEDAARRAWAMTPVQRIANRATTGSGASRERHPSSAQRLRRARRGAESAVEAVRDDQLVGA